VIGYKLLQEIKDFLDGKVDPEEFSFDLPSLLVETYKELQKENGPLAELLNDFLPDYCGYFCPDPAARSQSPDYLDEDQFRAKVKEVYEQALKLV
jgi:hypothetical protein